MLSRQLCYILDGVSKQHSSTDARRTQELKMTAKVIREKKKEIEINKYFIYINLSITILVR